MLVCISPGKTWENTYHVVDISYFEGKSSCDYMLLLQFEREIQQSTFKKGQGIICVPETWEQQMDFGLPME